ncbi:MAG: betaine/proline/choline family ABC transporter ATP-binding protein [Spirochaetales bacterium]|nr:betaine/proline/choline family ABC transporter ATP-binding protein [Spirochaetales bacterium]
MAIELKNITKKYGETLAVDDFSILIPDNKITVFIGPSGCGKTTTMKMINGLIKRTDGDIIINGSHIDEWDPIQLRRQIGYVIQSIGLFPHYTIYDNVATVPRLLKWDEGKIKERVYELLELVNLDPAECVDKYPAQLSGGQQQRVGVARGLAADPDILLMDEPFGAIDPINREQIQDSFLEIQKEIQKTIVFVTHDIHEAIKLGDYIAILDEGKLVQFDTAFSVVNTPATPLVEDLLGSDRAFKGLELLRVKDSMSSVPPTLKGDQTAGEAAKIMAEKNLSYKFVLNEKDQLLGYVSLKKAEASSPEIAVKEIIQDIETIQPNSTLLEAMNHIFAAALNTLPVVDSKNRLKGKIRMKTVLGKIEEIAGDDTSEDDEA